MHELRERRAGPGERKFGLEEVGRTGGGRSRGGLIGNQFGGGSGRTLLTVAGALGGGLPGHTVEAKQRDKIYEVIVRMDDGCERTVTYQSPPPVREGDGVRLRDGQLVLVVT